MTSMDHKSFQKSVTRMKCQLFIGTKVFFRWKESVVSNPTRSQKYEQFIHLNKSAAIEGQLDPPNLFVTGKPLHYSAICQDRFDAEIHLVGKTTVTMPAWCVILPLTYSFLHARQSNMCHVYLLNKASLCY